MSIYAGENLENLSFGHNCEIVNYEPIPGADVNGDEEYERSVKLGNTKINYHLDRVNK